MKKEEFDDVLKKNETVISQIKNSAATLHDITCNQKYGEDLPYSYHLNSTAKIAMQYGHAICESPEHVIPIVFGAYYHDAIEDARMTYNDVLKAAKAIMSEKQAIMATEIVYALTDEKGRNRKERGSEKHYEDIRNTPYASFVKFCDRFANMSYSAKHKSRMFHVYDKEHEDFMRKLGGTIFIPNELWKEMEQTIIDGNLSHM